jgi:YbgC/YbaW family acyl-CoA thioester hydrolase
MSASHAEPLPEAARVVLRRRIEWIDTDAAGIYHWTTAFRLLEAAEAALHTALGIEDRTFGAMPRISVSVDFRRPLRFNDPVEIDLAVGSLGRSSIVYALEIHGPDGLAVAGEVTACFVDKETLRAVTWPEDLRDRLAGGGLQEDPG